MTKPSLSKNAVYNVTYNVLRLIFPLVTYPYVSRIIGPSGIGTVSYAQTVATYFYMFATLGLPMYGSREISRARDDGSRFDRAYTELIGLAAFLTTIATLAYFALPLLFERFRAEFLLHAAFGLVVFTNFGRLDWFYRGIENYRYITLRNFAVRLLSVAAIFLVIRRPEHYLYYGFIWVAGSAISNLWNLGYSFKFARLDFAGFRPWRHLKALVPSFALVITGTLYAGVDTVMLGSMVADGGVSVGYYAIANRVIKIGISILIAGGAVVAPRIAYYYDRGDHDSVERVLRLNVWYTLFFGIPMVFGLWVLAGDVILLFGGREFAPAIPTLRLLSVQLLLMALTNITAFQILYARNREKKVLISQIVAATAAVVLNFLLIPLYKQNGAAMGTIAARGIDLILQGFFGFALLRSALLNKESLKIVVVSILLLGGLYAAYYLLEDRNIIVRVVVIVAASPPIYLGLAALFRVQILQRVMESVGKRLRKSRTDRV